MKMQYPKFIIIIMLLLFLCIPLKGIAQIYFRIGHPLVKRSTTNSVYIKAITITSTETRIDFVTCFTGRYIFLSPPYNKNSMYIKCGKMTYRLKRTIGISENDQETICEPNKILEFSAIFYPFINYKHARNLEFDIIEGENGSWNFYNISTDKKLASEISLVYKRAYWRGEKNWESYPNKSEWYGVPKTSSTKKGTRKYLKKNPNFKLE